MTECGLRLPRNGFNVLKCIEEAYEASISNDLVAGFDITIVRILLDPFFSTESLYSRRTTGIHVHLWGSRHCFEFHFGMGEFEEKLTLMPFAIFPHH